MAYRTKSEIAADIKDSKERLIQYLSKSFDLRASLIKSEANRLEDKLTDDRFELKTTKVTGVVGLVMAIAGGGFTALAAAVSIASATFAPGVFLFGAFAIGLGSFVKVRSDKKRKKLEEKLKNKRILTKEESEDVKQQLRACEKMAEAENNRLKNLQAEYCGAPQKVSTLKNLSTSTNTMQNNYDRYY